MSHGQPPRPPNPEPEDASLATAEVTSKQSALRSYRSAEAPRSLQPVSPPPNSLIAGPHSSSRPVSPAKKRPTMFSTLFSHTRAHPAQEPIEVEVGDFDHTPAPSPRSSLSMLRGNGDEASAVYESAATQTSGYRHHLLKTLVNGPIILHKDVPVLPILSPTAEKDISPQAEKKKLQHGSQDKSTAVRESMATVSPSPSTSPQNKRFTPSIPTTDRIRLESLVHLHDTHTHEHVSSALSPAGICDVDDLTQEETQVWPLPERNSASPVVYSMRDRKIDRHLSEEDKQITYSGAANFKHYPIRHQGWFEPGHPATNKVVPFKSSLTDPNRRSTENDGSSIYAQHQHQCDKLNAQSVSDMQIQIAATAEESPCLTPDQVSTPSQIDTPEALQSRSDHLVGSRVQACSSKTKPFIEAMRGHGHANGTIGGEAHISAQSNCRILWLPQTRSCSGDSLNTMDSCMGHHRSSKGRSRTQLLVANPKSLDATKDGSNKHGLDRSTRLPIEETERRHTIQHCDPYPLLGSENRHPLELFDNGPVEPVKIHREPPCLQTLTHDTTKTHATDQCTKCPQSPHEDQHTVRECSSDPIHHGFGQHPIRECTPCQSEQDQSQADLASYVYAPMPSQENFGHSEQSERYIEAGSDTSLRAGKGDEQLKSPAYSSGRSQSGGSVLDYKRTTAQWLKGLVQAPEAYSAKFTEIPTRKRSIARPLDNARRPSEPVLSNKATCHPADKSIHSGKSDPKIDGLSFKRAISDLERLLSEALTLASQVIDRSGSPNGGGCKRPSSSLHSGYRGRPGYREIDTNYLNDRSPTSERESAEDLSDFELSQQTTQVRPAYKHASTFAGPAERPKLAEIIENYSRKYEDLHPRSVDTRMRLRSQPSQSPGQSMAVIPTRNSRKQATQRPLRKLVNGEVLAPVHRGGKPREENLTPVLNFNLGKDALLGDKSLEKRPVGEHTPSAGRNATSQEALPERDVAGRKVRAEHGISLRRRSHVSLRNVQGFSLPKSHKRQPIARD
ncbi:Major facilitator superfamily transporter [Ilyonectria robusta]